MKWMTNDKPKSCPDSNNHFKYQKESDPLYYQEHNAFNDEEIKRIINCEKNDPWLLERLYHYMNKANDKGWHYSIDGEQIQLHNYKPGNQYMWHRDGIVGHNSVIKNLADPLHNLTRKISMTILLNEPSEFTGGKFQIKKHDIEDFTIDMKKGTVVVFPAWLGHRVTPIKTGERHSLPVFFYGRPFS